MKALLENDFVVHYKLNSSNVVIDCISTNSTTFDIDDMPSPIKILSAGDGKVTFKNVCFGELDIVPYEIFIDQCKKPSSFLNGRKKCDYLLIHKSNDGYSLLVELTSSLGSTYGLERPIYNKKGEVIYSGGKYEKSVDQLAGSLADLLDVPAIKQYLTKRKHKTCLMAYRVNPHTNMQYLVTHPFERYLEIESKETAENGAIIPCPKIEQYGFEYRRINHVYAFNLE